MSSADAFHNTACSQNLSGTVSNISAVTMFVNSNVQAISPPAALPPEQETLRTDSVEESN
jgi:hypothetical protein